MLRVRCKAKLTPLDSHNTSLPHDFRHTILRTANMLDIVKLMPDPWATVILVIVPEYLLYLNEQLLVINPPLTLGSLFIRVISAPRYFQGSAHLLERKNREILIYEFESFPVSFENMPTAFLGWSSPSQLLVTSYAT
jgi:hypothetical protein